MTTTLALALCGKRYGKLLVIRKSDKKDNHRRVYWNCKCECGGNVTTRGDYLRNGTITSCGCDYVGNTALIGCRFGRLTVISDSLKRAKGKNIKWRCLCDCGKIVDVVSTSLRSGDTRSCGCLVAERLIERLTTHGFSKTAEYYIWRSMKGRCNNPKNPSYKNYGGRGITICSIWLNSFDNFIKDMGKRPSVNHSIDRYPDNEGNYEPSNCRWATPKEQTRNMRRNVYYEHNGERMIKRDWATKLHIDPSTILLNIRKGLSFHEIYDKFSQRVSGFQD